MPPTTSRAKKQRLITTIVQNEVAKCELAGSFSTAPKPTLQAVGSKNSKPISTTKMFPLAKIRYVSTGQSGAFIEANAIASRSTSGKSGGLNGSTQHFLEVYSQE